MPDVEDCPSAYLKEPEAFAIADGLRDCYQIPKDADEYTRVGQMIGKPRAEAKHLCFAAMWGSKFVPRWQRDLAQYAKTQGWPRPADYVGPNKFNMRNADYRTVKAGEKLEAGQFIEFHEDDFGDAVAYAWRVGGCKIKQECVGGLELDPARTTITWTGCSNTVTVRYHWHSPRHFLFNDQQGYYEVNRTTNGGSWSQRKEAEQSCKATIRNWLTKEGYR